MKKLLLSIVPALMLLSSCSGAQPQVENKLFQETTVAQEEVAKKAHKNTITPAVTPKAPKVGVRVKDQKDGHHSVRFLAAITADDLSTIKASWTRTMYLSTGAVQKETRSNIACTYAYTKLVDETGEGFINISDDGFEGYNCFVVYTMTNVPDAYLGSYLNAQLTIDSENNAFDFTTDIVSTTVDESKQISFPSSKRNYFISGIIGGNEDIVSEDSDYATKPLPDGKVTRFTQELDSDDVFYVVKNYVDADPQKSSFRIYDSSCIRENPYFIADGNKIKVTEDRSYVFYIDDVNELDVESGYYVSYTNNSDTVVINPLTFAGKDGEDKDQFKGTIAPKNGSLVSFIAEGSATPLSISGQSGNFNGALTVKYGGPELDLYLKRYGSNPSYNYDVWCGYPECYVTIDEAISPAESRAEKSGNLAIFDLDLTADEKVIVYCGYENKLYLGDSEYYEYTAPATTNYVFYINSECKVYIDELTSITFTVDVSGFEGDVDSVYLAGDFNGWGEHILMSNGGSGDIYSATLDNLVCGKWITFKFGVNNTEWEALNNTFIIRDNIGTASYVFDNHDVNVILGPYANDGAVVYAWAWKGSGAGSWYEYDSVNQCYHLNGCDNIKFVRFASGTTKADWKGDIWNETGNIELHDTGTLKCDNIDDGFYWI